jgi:TolA-binding protein
MTTIELHPEHLLGRVAELEAEERASLDRHVAACPACALHLRARELMGDDLRPRQTDAALDLAAIDRAMALVQSERDDASRHHGSSRWSVRVLMAALVLGGVAAGARYTHRHEPAASPSAGRVELGAPGDVGPRTTRGGPRVATQPAEALETRETPANPVPPDPVPRSPASQPLPPRAKAVGPKALPSESAEELFARANQLRRGGRDAEAMAAYRELQRAFPNSREGKLSQATLARLELEHGRAAEALSGFDSYLKSGDTGAMTEDALVGRAVALQKLDRRDEERATWQELLARFPNSIHRSRARARLGELR